MRHRSFAIRSSPDTETASVTGEIRNFTFFTQKVCLVCFCTSSRRSGIPVHCVCSKIKLGPKDSSFDPKNDGAQGHGDDQQDRTVEILPRKFGPIRFPIRPILYLNIRVRCPHDPVRELCVVAEMSNQTTLPGTAIRRGMHKVQYIRQVAVNCPIRL